MASVHGNFTPELTWSFGHIVTDARTGDQVESSWSNAWNLAWTDPTNGLEQFYPVGTTFGRTRVALLDATYHETQHWETPAGHPGTATGDTLPYLNSIVVTKRSTFTKRWNRGRMYMPALEETFVNDNVLIPAAATKMALAVRGVFNAMTASGTTFFVVSKKPHKDTTGLYARTQIVDWEVSNKPARQSRRVKKQVATYY